MTDADIIVIVRQLRKLVATLDSIGFPAKSLYADEEMSLLIPSGLSSKLAGVTVDIYTLLQNIEKNRKYRDAVKQLCVTDERNDDG